GLDVVRALLAGDRGIEAYTVVHLGGHAELGRLVRELEDHLAGRGRNAADLIGDATDHTLTYAEAAATRGGSGPCPPPRGRPSARQSPRRSLRPMPSS